MSGQIPEYGERVNILLPMEDEASERTVRPPGEAEWSAEEYREVQAAATELDDREIQAAPPDPKLVQEVLSRLAGRDETRFAVFGAGAEDQPSADEADAIQTSELGEVGPPADRPFLIPEIGVLSVPNPDPGERGVASVMSALGDLRTRLSAAPSQVFEAIGEVIDEELVEEENGVGMELDQYLESIAGDEWLEASLEFGTAAETLPWGIGRVNAPRAWAMGCEGQSIRVAVVDTGIGPHIDLGAPVASATFVPGTTSANDDNDHGTHVAGTILARRNRIGVVGVAPRALLMRAKVLNRIGSGLDTWIAAGIVWAANHGARIINLSLGARARSEVIERAIHYATIVRKALVVAAAGNDFGGPVLYPARNPLCVAVAATDQNNRRATFSNRGPELDIAAPGVNVLSTLPSNGYGVLNGTSMATPHVAGVAAIALARKPLMGPFQTRSLMEQTAIPLGPIVDFGRGLVQADRVAVLVTTPFAAEVPAIHAHAEETGQRGAASRRSRARTRPRRTAPSAK
jgi:subtilisin family serine protease